MIIDAERLSGTLAQEHFMSQSVSSEKPSDCGVTDLELWVIMNPDNKLNLFHSRFEQLWVWRSLCNGHFIIHFIAVLPHKDKITPNGALHLDGMHGDESWSNLNNLHEV